MSQSDLQAVYTATRARLIAGTETWGTRVYPDIADESATYPYVVMFWLGGGEANIGMRPDASLVVGMKCVSKSLSQAMEGAARIAELLNDAERGVGLNGGADWHVASVTREGAIHMVEVADGGRVYHEGNRYRFNLEQKD